MKWGLLFFSLMTSISSCAFAQLETYHAPLSEGSTASIQAAAIGPLFRIGDVTGDGIADFAEMLGFSSLAPPQVGIRDGKSIALVRAFTTSSDGSGFSPFNGRILPTGDLNGDGVPEVVVLRSFSTPSIVDPLTGIPVASQVTSAALSLPSSIMDAVAGPDVDGDGRPEIVCLNLNSSVSLISTASAGGQVLWSTPPLASIIFTRSSGAVLDDVDGDGVGDLVLGLPRSIGTFGMNSPGLVVCLSGATGGVIFQRQGAAGAFLGKEVDRFRDINGDGHDDIAVAAAGTELLADGYLEIISATDGSCLWSSASDPSIPYGVGPSMDVSVDVTGDGVPDIIAGIPDGVNDGMGSPFPPVVGPPVIHSLVIDGATLTVRDKFFTPAPGAPRTMNRSPGVHVTGVGDINDDGFNDIVVTGFVAALSSSSSFRVTRVAVSAGGVVDFGVSSPTLNLSWSSFSTSNVDGALTITSPPGIASALLLLSEQSTVDATLSILPSTTVPFEVFTIPLSPQGITTLPLSLAQPLLAADDYFLQCGAVSQGTLTTSNTLQLNFVD